jgi:hypothetical protein
MHWRGPAANVNGKPILLSERMLPRTMTAGVQLKNKNLTVSLKGLGAKMN